MIAKRYPSQRSVLGSYLDPMADKILINTIMVSLYFQAAVPGWLAGLVVFRDLGLIAGTLTHRFMTAPRPLSLSTFFRVSTVEFEVKPSLLGKVNTAVCMVMITGTIVSLAIFSPEPVPTNIHTALTALQYFVGFGTVASGASYFFATRSTFKQIVHQLPLKFRK
eukprot:c14137_g1_i2.p2 GENE.c14137_g1_i2~~c14137_g1_i2.p2  ORF type:complete len:165 (+),score=32.88 c14137_g1_i2:347-841(+)